MCWKNRKITPRADLDPVHLAGSIIRSVTLHNSDYIKEKDIMINDTIVLHKAGDVIPEVVRVEVSRRNGEEIPFKMIENCPICGSKLVKNEDEVAWYCKNPKCDARNIEGLIHFSSRATMNIDGFGESIVEDFYNIGYLKTIPDYYRLYNHKEELKELEGFGEKSINNLLDSIEASKKNSLEMLLFALGIRFVGKETAKVLAKHYKNIDALLNTTKEELLSIEDIGTKIAQSVYETITQEKFINLITDLKKLGLENIFDTPKPVELIKFLIRISTNSNDIVLDFFAGSGTLAQAVYEVNAEDNKNISYVLIQLDEPVNTKSPVYQKCRSLNIRPSVDSILKYRVESFLNKSQKEIDFKYYEMK